MKKILKLSLACFMVAAFLISCSSTDDAESVLQDETNITLDTAQDTIDLDKEGNYESPMLIVYNKGTREGEKVEVRAIFTKNPYVRLVGVKPCPENPDKEIWICNVSPQKLAGKPGGSQQAGSKDPIRNAKAGIVDCTYEIEDGEEDSYNEGFEE